MEVDASHWCERDKESCRKWIQWNENFFLFLCQVTNPNRFRSLAFAMASIVDSNVGLQKQCSKQLRLQRGAFCASSLR